MVDTETPEGKLTAELRELGKNLTEVLRSAWDQPERKRLQQEIANGLSELGSTLKDETRKLSEAPPVSASRPMWRTSRNVQTGRLN
jgi:hypothetical protein